MVAMAINKFIVIAAENFASKYLTLVKGYEYNTLCILFLKSRCIVPPVIEGISI